MRTSAVPRFTKRYGLVTAEKAGGATYTPSNLADFVAQQVVAKAGVLARQSAIRVLDPAVGDGELLVSLIKKLGTDREIEVHGFDLDPQAIATATERLCSLSKKLTIKLTRGDFLEHVLKHFGGNSPTLFPVNVEELPKFDLVIANPPYVRTQIMGATHAQLLAEQFGLTGRVDLYHAFLIAMSRVMKTGGVGGIIVSNRFMTTRAGSSVRSAVRRNFTLRHVWDLGDTKLFKAAVLPAVLLVEGKNDSEDGSIGFTSIYETTEPSEHAASDAIEALKKQGVVEVEDGRHFDVRHGHLHESAIEDVWRLDCANTDEWLTTVERHTALTFGQVGKIRVGVKTCADKVFIREDWSELNGKEPELLKPLTTHHIGRRFKAEETKSKIIYPHVVENGSRRSVELSKFPKSLAYLEEHRASLESRKYVLEAGRQWFEIWVPQDPAAWHRPKLVFRDISERPMFWIDLEGTVVNGDCYWMMSEKKEDDALLWLAAAVANSTFIEAFYDRRFNNKLYAGRRRFITQYVQEFPLPDPKRPEAKNIVELSKAMYEEPENEARERELDALVWSAFGLSNQKSL